MNGIFLLLGTNIGDKSENLQKAAALLTQSGNIHITDYSSVYKTAAWGKTDQDDFLNIVLRIDTQLPVEELLIDCQSVETAMGRERIEKWGSRIIDIDILYYDNDVKELENLTVPHPGIPDRRFTLIPLVELVPNEIHPVLQKSQAELLADCSDVLACEPTDIDFIL